MRLPALLLLALVFMPTLIHAQGELPAGDVIVTVRSEAGHPLAEAEVRIESQQAVTDARGSR